MRLKIFLFQNKVKLKAFVWRSNFSDEDSCYLQLQNKVIFFEIPWILHLAPKQSDEHFLADHFLESSICLFYKFLRGWW